MEKKYKAALERLKAGNYDIAFEENDETGKLIESVATLTQSKLDQFNKLFEITEQINGAVNLEDIWNHVYDAFKEIIPYDRIGVSRLVKENTVVQACWYRSENKDARITKGYSAPLAGSSLQKIIETGEPRIINDLEAYYQNHSNSHSTKLILEEGMRSSLTCPTYAMGKPTGFIFFSSKQKNTYRNAHVGMFRQISNHLGMIVEKSRIMERLKELDELKNQFLGIAAHDLRSPANTIKYQIYMWKDGYLGEFSDKQKNSMDVIERNCDRMKKMIDDLLDLSAIESGEIKIEKKETDLKQLIQDYYKNNMHKSREKSISLTLDIEKKIPPVYIDSERILQVLENYVSNAIKYSHPDTEVIISGKKTAEKIVVAVQDQGQGISKENQKNLFKKFGKAGVKPTGKEKSTGLGLYICKKIIEKHQGQVGVKSKVGKGSTFWFTLPLKN